MVARPVGGPGDMDKRNATMTRTRTLANATHMHIQAEH